VYNCSTHQYSAALQDFISNLNNHPKAATLLLINDPIVGIGSRGFTGLSEDVLHMVPAVHEVVVAVNGAITNLNSSLTSLSNQLSSAYKVFSGLSSLFGGGASSTPASESLGSLLDGLGGLFGGPNLFGALGSLFGGNSSAASNPFGALAGLGSLFGGNSSAASNPLGALASLGSLFGGASAAPAAPVASSNPLGALAGLGSLFGGGSAAPASSSPLGALGGLFGLRRTDDSSTERNTDTAEGAASIPAKVLTAETEAANQSLSREEAINAAKERIAAEIKKQLKAISMYNFNKFMPADKPAPECSIPVLYEGEKPPDAVFGTKFKDFPVVKEIGGISDYASLV
jgi:hypothetical protein